jgi:hypothetical protein
MNRDENPPTSGPPSQADDRRWVLGSLVALVAIAVFFIAIGRYEGMSPTTTGQSSQPANPGPSAGSSSLPKGPASN